jgi:selenocysteine lyase/cysteine desulfurase
MTIDWQRVHEQFPINRRLTWLNNCGISAMPGPVLVRLQAHLQAMAEGGVTGVPSEGAVHDSVRARLSRLIGADQDELTLIHHTAEGLTFVSHGLDLAPGDRLVLMEHEYPSNVYPWQHWQDRGVQLAFAPLADTPEGFMAGLRPLLQPPTRVVSLSAVHWCTGLPLPLVEIGRLCAERDVLLVVDGAQGVGLVDIDVRAAGIGAMAFSAWKWLLGPIGLGAMYLRRDLIDRLRFPFKGTGSVIDDHNHLPYRDALKPGADRYVLSTPNYNDWVHFDASLEYLEGLGFCGGARTNPDAGRPALESLARGRLVTGQRRVPAQANGIVAAARPGVDAPELVSRLQQHGVVGAARLGRLRLSPHVYLSEEQLERAVSLIVAQAA